MGRTSDPAAIGRALTKTKPRRYVSLPGGKLGTTKFCFLCGREYMGPMVEHLKGCGK